MKQFFLNLIWNLISEKFSNKLAEFKKEILDEVKKEMDDRMSPKKVQKVHDPNRITRGSFTIRKDRSKDKDLQEFSLSRPLFGLIDHLAFEYPFIECHYLWKQNFDTLSQETKESIERFLKKLHDMNAVTKVTMNSHMISVYKSGAADWEDMNDSILNTILDLMEELNPEKSRAQFSEMPDKGAYIQHQAG